MYLTTEPPSAAARRARLRFRRAKFNFNLERVGFKTQTICSLCRSRREDNHHVICECPAHDAARDVCYLALSHLVPLSLPNPLIPLSLDGLISPETACASYPHLIPLALNISAAFFKQIAAARAF